MNRSEFQDKLGKKFLCHDVVTAMSAIPADIEELTSENLHDILTGQKFLPHEITQICHAVFS